MRGEVQEEHGAPWAGGGGRKGLDKDEGENWGGDSLVGGVFKFGKVGLDSSLKLLDPPQSSRDWRHVLADRRRT